MLSAFLVLLLAGASGAATPDWPSWGGPNGNFVVNGKGLPRTFADSPPKQVWQRSLGDGYSSIVSDGALLYSMYRRGSEEVVVAIDPANGTTKWEYAYEAIFQPGMVTCGGTL